MTHRSLTILAFVIALLLTVLGWREVMIYKYTPPTKLALWFPLIVLLRSQDFGAVFVSLIQFPLFALAFRRGLRRWPPGKLLAGLVALYAACVVAALMFIRWWQSA